MRLFKPLSVLFLLISFNAIAQTNTQNIGFEDGTLNNWQCFIGHIDSVGVIHLLPSPPVDNRHTIYGKESASLHDPYGGFPVLCPNGSKYSVRLGNRDSSAEAERITYTFKVPTGSAYNIIFNYAVVLENPDHLPFQQPKFTAQVYDVTDNKYIDCPSFNFVASFDLPGFKLSKAKGEFSVFYKDWSTATIDLRGYLGKTIRLEFTTNDCTKGGHFGYAYLDVNEDIGSSISGNAYCTGQNSVTLFAPNGFYQYYWYNADMSKQIGFGQTLTISPPPPDLTTYALKVLPYPELGCVDTIYTVVNKIDAGFKLNVLDTVYGCPGTGVDLTAATITAGSSPGIELSYFNDSLVTSYLYNPNMVTASGRYYIQGINKEGCMNVLPVQVILALPDIGAADPPAVVFPVRIDLSKTFTPKKGVTYTYYTDSAATRPLYNYVEIQYGGTFYIKAVNNVGCVNVAHVNVVIHPPLPYTVTAPNTFTPNYDGINDNFTVSAKGSITFISLMIFNRAGQLIYETKSSNNYWDGTYDGSALPVGTYYWVFEGIDDYYHAKVNRAASIALIR